MASSKDSLEFSFLSDQPLNTPEEFESSAFGHREITEALRDIVSACPAPFTVGLFGKWGAGKSSIANHLREELEPEPVVIFDVWKHQGDALRRTFLRESLRQLRDQHAVDSKFELNERLDKSEHVAGRSRSLENTWNTVLWTFAAVVGVLVVATIVDWLAFDWRHSRAIMAWVGAAGFVAAAVIVARVVKGAVDTLEFVLSSFVSSKAVTYTVDKFSDPHEFETEFGRLLCALKSKRLVVIFDNLDRVDHDRVVEVLATIKTFLEPKDLENPEKETVFVVPCDDRAIRACIEKVYGEDDRGVFSPQEFLKKFFGAVIWIPEVMTSELEVYTRSLLQSTRVPALDDDRIAWIITKAYRQNPRQVKQFANILLANYVLLWHRQRDGGDVLAGDLASLAPQLARFLILIEMFPSQMEIMRTAHVATLTEGLMKAADQLAQNNRDFESFRDFVSETAVDFPIADIRPFFTLRRSEYEKRFPGIEDFFELLEDGRREPAVEFLKEIPEFQSNREEFCQVVKQRLEETSNETSRVVAAGTLLAAVDQLGLTLTETAYAKIYNVLTANWSRFTAAQPSVVARQLLQYGQYQRPVIEKWVWILGNLKTPETNAEVGEEYLRDLVEVVCERPEWFEAWKEEVSVALAANFGGHTWALDAIVRSPGAQQRFVSSVFVESVVQALTPDQIRTTEGSRVVDGLLSLPRENFGPEVLVLLESKLAELITVENGRPADDDSMSDKGALLSMVERLLVELRPGFREYSDQIQGGALSEALTRGYREIPDVDSRRIFVPSMLEVEGWSTGTTQQASATLEKYFRAASLPSVEFVAERVHDRASLVEAGPYAEVLLERALGDQAFFSHFYPLVSSESQEEWLLALLEHDPSRLVAFLEAQDYMVPASDTIAGALLARLEKAPSADEGPMLRAIGRLDCAADKAPRYASVISRELRSENRQMQEIGRQALEADTWLDRQAKREIAKDVLDWLRAPALVDKFQKDSLQVVVRESSLLDPEEKGELTQLIFEDIIRKSSDAAAIAFGFDQLAVLQPRYLSRKANFDDIRSRIDSEPEGKVRTALVRGLRLLRPKGPSGRPKDYWDWLDSLQS